MITQINLGRALTLGGDFQGGLGSNRQARETCEVLVAANPRNADYRRLLSITWQNDGDYRAILQDFDGALESFRKKLPFDEQALAEDPRNAVARGDFAYTRERMGDLLAALGRYREALASYRLAAEFRGSGEQWPDDPAVRFRIILTRAGIAEMEARIGETAAAIADYTHAMQLLGEIPVDPSSSIRSSLRGQAHMRFGDIHAALGESESLGAAERQLHWQAARDSYVQSQGVWRDMLDRRILTAEDRTKPEDVARKIMRSDTALHQLNR